MNIKEQRQLLENLLVDGKLYSLSVQAIALNVFANSIGYEAVNGDIRKGFIGYDHDTWNVTHNISLEDMQSCYNRGFRTLRTSAHKVVGDKVVERISLQYNKKIGKLTSELCWLKFVKED
ncbi:hypothetical protein phiA019_0063 [Aeromonas phage phiA019]|nr:hypothetical protein phiA009_0067 [Aeromonas phage phiA009]ULG01600.1 hypothetical protein phiA019_0063 [Aeromonas phage phiA019]